MSCILNIETSTQSCSVALSLDSRVIFDRIILQGSSHAANLGIFVLETIEFAKKKNLMIEAVAISEGPGSYTGLRIGASLAKGLCYGMEIPLIAVPTLKIMARHVIDSLQVDEENIYFCPMIDARRMEVYSAVYDKNLLPLREVCSEIINENSYNSYFSKGKICFFGDGASKCKTVINSKNALFIDNISPLATMIPPLATKAFHAGEFVDTAYFEPFYLKEFQATVAKNRLL
ncbi:MAG: tRNA (adenosine(37)-N6)-threonylcarbamoyltransferase complex dimerization subunit type 1 TsaB [Dysgonamonadaceae bacterium]|jgi:tRNA threonylcarbamoyladenosine biosynthesis protein TsaB|nr:tRNA (adenosine(37)-N6)-threonylcarbamoyltransferase complex dimerization subunit type 1 TsaB [Dysgonamonadaceae bacterium]